MTTHVELSSDEREVLLDLLQQERHELPSEIRHTDTTKVREELKARLALIDQTIAKLRLPATVTA